jgi:hypothetical protein
LYKDVYTNNVQQSFLYIQIQDMQELTIPIRYKGNHSSQESCQMNDQIFTNSQKLIILIWIIMWRIS